MLKWLVRAASDLVVSSVQPALSAQFQEMKEQQASQAVLVGKLNATRVAGLPDHAPISQAEFKVFSQWGEDGILQFLFARVATPNRFFIEFGVQNYVESNTRFLLLNDNWSGLVMDAAESNVEYIRRDPLYWRYELTAACAFITAENINDLIRQHAPTSDIGLLSIDIDGNDYWIWRAITSVTPRIVVIEYNSVFGPRHAVTIPYEPGFERTRAHHSNLYWGTSLAALCELAASKGYQFVGSNSAGNNAFFVRKDCAQRLPALSAEEGYIQSKFRESRDEGGRLTFAASADRLALIAAMKVYDLRRDVTVAIGELRS
jgi:hypothetical protein